MSRTSIDRLWQPRPVLPTADLTGRATMSRKVGRVLDGVGIATVLYLATLVVMAIEQGIGAA